MVKRLTLLAAIPLFSLFMSACSQKPDTVDVYFARHGNTIFNGYDRVQGWSNTPLTKEGQKTARYLGEGLKGINFGSYYTSDLGRQRETMQFALEQKGVRNPKIQVTKDLREVFFGDFEGLSNTVMQEAAYKRLGYSSRKDFADALSNSKADLAKYTDVTSQVDPKNEAETADQVRTRMQRALHNIVQNALKNGDRNVLVVSSGRSIAMLISDMTNDPNKNLEFANGAVIKITYKNGRYHLGKIGDTRYVDKGRQVLTGEGGTAP